MAGPLDFLRLTRLHTGAATAAVPAVAAVTAGGDPLAVLLVASSALLHHAWGFSQNEICDLGIDSRAGHLSHKPLVSGSISAGKARMVSFGALALSAALMVSAAVLGGGSLAWTISLFALATASGWTYNTFGKRVPFMDLAVGSWFLLLILGSATAVGPERGTLGIVVGIAIVAGAHLVFNNMIEGGIKDASTDRSAGARSAAVVLGVRYSGDRIGMPNGFLGIALALRGAFVVGVSVLSYLAYARTGVFWTMAVTTAGSLVVLGHSLSFLGRRVRLHRDGLLRRFSLHEIMSYTLSVLAVSPVLGPYASIAAIIVPMLWFWTLNRVMFGSGMRPGV